MNATNYGRARIAALIQFLEQQGYSPNHIAAHVRTEWTHHATAGSVAYGEGIAAACREFFDTKEIACTK